jgi:hypothetical protein
MFPIMDEDMPAPIIVPVESEAAPAHVPLIVVVPEVGEGDVVDVGVVGLIGIDDPPPQAAPARATPTSATKSSERMLRLLFSSAPLGSTDPAAAKG